MLMRAMGSCLAFLSAGPAFAAGIVFEGGGEHMKVDGSTLVDLARSTRDDGMNEIQFQLSDEDTQRFAELTTRLQGEVLSIVVCGTVLAAPTVMLPITDGSVLITGGTDEGTEALFDALEMRAPCPAE